MRVRMQGILIPALIPLLATVACTDSTQDPAGLQAIAVPVFNQAEARNFRAHARGAEEVPPVDTRAQGQAIFQVSRDGNEISYKLIVANIENVTMAHIHEGAVGVNGAPLVWLYPSTPGPVLIEGRTQGILAEGVITDDDLVGSLEGKDLDDLIAAMRSGDTYVNVHTSQNGAGEVRGQIH